MKKQSMKETSKKANQLLRTYLNGYDEESPVDQLLNLSLCQLLSCFQCELKKEYEKKERTMTNGVLIYNSLIKALTDVKNSVEAGKRYSND
jgi:transcription elongation factor Elf1